MNARSFKTLDLCWFYQIPTICNKVLILCDLILEELTGLAFVNKTWLNKDGLFLCPKICPIGDRWFTALTSRLQSRLGQERCFYCFSFYAFKSSLTSSDDMECPCSFLGSILHVVCHYLLLRAKRHRTTGPSHLPS